MELARKVRDTSALVISQDASGLRMVDSLRWGRNIAILNYLCIIYVSQKPMSNKNPFPLVDVSITCSSSIDDVTEALWDSDVNRLRSDQYTLNLQSRASSSAREDRASSP